MAFVAVIVVFVAIVVAMSAGKSRGLVDPNGPNAGLGSSGASYEDVAETGVPARGILLAVQPFATSIPSAYFRRYELRQVTIDVEIAGRSPYVVDTGLYVPMNLSRDILPGATIELRVDPSGANLVAVGLGAGMPPFPVAAPPPPPDVASTGP